MVGFLKGWVINILFYDFEVFKHDWIICWLDTETKKIYNIVNDKHKFEKFYEHYKNVIWVGYNSRNYDQWIAKSILCDFNPYDMNEWIIIKDRKGFEFSKLLNKFTILNYDCSVGFRSLKELEAFMGHNIHETSVPFDIDRNLTTKELQSTIEYCNNDVMETFEVFLETKSEFESHIGLVKEFELPISMLGKTKAQLSAEILGANKVERNDEFNIKLPDNILLGKYKFIQDYFYDWAKNSKNYKEITLKTNVCGIPHVFGIGGIHGSKNKYYGTGYYIMADVASYYPAGMIEYDFLSRNVLNKNKYKQIRDDRIKMKANKDPRQAPRKIVLNGTFGASKDKYNKLYDPLQANNLCIANQLFLLDLLEKLEGKCEIIQSNTDGVLLKLFKKEDKEKIIKICNAWEKRTRFTLEFDEYSTVIQKDVNNYIIIDNNGGIKRKGTYVKKLNNLDNDLPIVNKAIVNYFTKHIDVEKTINACNELIQFQKITKVSGKYEYASYSGNKMYEKVYRVFASLSPNDTTLYKKHKMKDTLDKTAGTPICCFIENGDITNVPIPTKLDKEWYINLAKDRIKEFIGLQSYFNVL